MPRHEFRTIEEFVKWIEVRIPPDEELGACPEGRYNCGLKDAYEAIADILRTSNIGIVYPPSDVIQILFPVKEALAVEAALADKEENDEHGISDVLRSAFERIVRACYDVDRLKFLL